MAFVTKCPHCNATRFEMKEIEPNDSGYKLNVMQCVGCGAPFGVTDYWNIGTLLKQQEAQIKELRSQLSAVSHAVQQIAQVMRR